MASNLEIVKLLLENGANVDEKDNNGCTTLHMASWKGYLKTVKVFENYMERELENII